MNSSVVLSAPYESFDLDMNDAYMISAEKPTPPVLSLKVRAVLICLPDVCPGFVSANRLNRSLSVDQVLVRPISPADQ